MEQVTLINGNGKPYTLELPKIVWVTSGKINDVALAHVKENTGLDFLPNGYGYEAQPTESHQITTLLMTYNFKTRYYNNWSLTNTLQIKSDHHVGFDVDCICRKCADRNHIRTEIQDGEWLAC